MVKILVSALAILAVTSTAALACGSHKSGGKGSISTSEAPAPVVLVRSA